KGTCPDAHTHEPRPTVEPTFPFCHVCHTDARLAAADRLLAASGGACHRVVGRSMVRADFGSRSDRSADRAGLSAGSDQATGVGEPRARPPGAAALVSRWSSRRRPFSAKPMVGRAFTT